MPELPEVEHFRSLLEPLISSKYTLYLERGSLDTKPPRKFLDDDQIAYINKEKYFASKISRRGKLIAMTLVQKDATSDSAVGTKFLMVHMGMTGRISTPEVVPELKEVKASEYPPPHVYLKFTSGSKEASFSDPRKFGSILLANSLEDLESLAPDAWMDVHDESKPALIEKLTNQPMGIKAMLLDQRRVVAGVGNWVADEVLYQTRIHPDQTYLTTEQATLLLETLHSILSTAVNCLVEKHCEFPSDWLFHYRWNSKKTTNDAHGRVVTFVTSGGRTSAIVPSLQQKKGQSKSKNPSVHAPKKKKSLTVKTEAPSDEPTPTTKPSPNKSKRKIAAVKEEIEIEIKGKEPTRKKAKAKAESSSAKGNGQRRRSVRLAS